MLRHTFTQSCQIFQKLTPAVRQALHQVNRLNTDGLNVQQDHVLSSAVLETYN